MLIYNGIHLYDGFRVVYSLLLNEKGGVEADVTVSILDGGSGQLHEPIFKVKSFIYIVPIIFHVFCIKFQVLINFQSDGP